MSQQVPIIRYKYEMGLRVKAKGVALERGSWIHDLLMHHYDGEDWEAAHATRTAEFENLFDEEREELGDLPNECERILRSYLRRYAKEDEQYHVIDTELNEVVTLPNGLELVVIVDLVWEDDRGRLWAVDHKTRKNFSDADSMLLDPQLTLYYWALERLGYKPLGGVLYNEIRTKPPTLPQVLRDGTLSRRKNIDCDAYTYAAEIKRLGQSLPMYADHLRYLQRRGKDRYFRRTSIPKDPPVLKTMVKETVQTAQEILAARRHNRFPRTFLPQTCKWDCEFLDICLVELHGGNIEPLIKQDFEVSKRGD